MDNIIDVAFCQYFLQIYLYFFMFILTKRQIAHKVLTKYYFTLMTTSQGKDSARSSLYVYVNLSVPVKPLSG